MPGLANPKSALISENAPDVGVAPFEFTTQANILEFEGSGACAGGGASAAVRVASTLQIVADVSGCRFLSTPENDSGDSLTYLIGPRWTPSPNRRVVPHFELMVGGHKMTTEELFPDLKRELQASGRLKGLDDYEAHSLYARHAEVNGPALALGGGMRVKMTRALAVQVADFQYLHTWTPSLDGIDRTHSYRLTTGLILRMGTW